MDFGSWSPSHLIIVLLAFATIIGQTIALLSRLRTTTERLEKQFVEIVNTMNQQLSDIRSEMNQQLSDIRGEIRDVRMEMSKLNQNHIDHLNQHHNPRC